MKNLIVLLILFVLPQRLLAQKKGRASINTTSIKTLEYIFDKVNIDDLDNVFIERGFAYNGSSKRRDTVSLVYRRPESFTTIIIDLISEKKCNVSYYTQFDLAAGYIINSAKASGYKTQNFI